MDGTRHYGSPRCMWLGNGQVMNGRYLITGLWGSSVAVQLWRHLSICCDVHFLWFLCETSGELRMPTGPSLLGEGFWIVNAPVEGREEKKKKISASSNRAEVRAGYEAVAEREP